MRGAVGASRLCPCNPRVWVPSFQNLLVLSFVFIYLAGDWSRKLWIPDLNRRFWKEELSSQYWSWRAFSVGFTHLAGVSPMTSSCLKGVSLGLHTYSCFWRHSQCDFFFLKMFGEEVWILFGLKRTKQPPQIRRPRLCTFWEANNNGVCKKQKDLCFVLASNLLEVEKYGLLLLMCLFFLLFWTVVAI